MSFHEFDDSFYYMTADGLKRLTHTEFENMSYSATQQQILASMLGKATGAEIDYPYSEPKKVKKDYNTVGVKFISGSNLGKSYTYRVVKRAKLRLGQEIVVPTLKDGAITSTIAVVVELHKTPQDTGTFDYKFVIGTVKPL